MKSTFNGECFTIGFIEALFLVRQELNEEECFRYLYLCKKYDQQQNKKIVEYRDTFIK